MQKNICLKALCGLAVIFAMPFSSNALNNCFTQADSKSLTFDVIQQAPPPKFGKTEYVQDSPVYPATIYSTAASEKIAQPSPVSPNGLSFKNYYALWANRCLYMKGITPSLEECRNTQKIKGNYYTKMIKGDDNIQLRPMFSTYKRANACTLIQAGNVMGEPHATLEAAATQAGLTLFDRTNDDAALKALSKKVDLANGDSRNYYVDVCLLETVPMASDGQGIILDYEVWDDRTSEEALSFFSALESKVKKLNKQLIIYTNDISTAGVHNGITASNVRTLMNVVDGFAPVVWSGATAGNPAVELKPSPRRQSYAECYKKQLDIMTNNGASPLTLDEKKKFILAVSLHDLQMSDAIELRNIILAEQYRGVSLWRNWERQGGSCDLPVNQAIGCITLGRCGK